MTDSLLNDDDITSSTLVEQGFYDSLPVQERFLEVAHHENYAPLPEGWFVGVADIVNSTGAIDRGQYKAVNTVGAAVISSQINASPDQRFPFVFGGDGAAFAVRPDRHETAELALAAVRRWAQDEFEFEVRAALVPVSDIREAGFDVMVARYRASPNIDYAMFAGGGVAWADQMMKTGAYSVEAAPLGTFPDLTGLSCRWTPMDSRNGRIVSLLVLPDLEADADAVDAVMDTVVDLVEHLDRAGTPVPEEGPGFVWPPEGLELEARATKGKTSLWRAKLKLLFETFIALIFFKAGLKAGGFDAKHYTLTTGNNADFRKYDDGLKMTIDCDDGTLNQLRTLLEEASDQGLVQYGLYDQDQAIMTCIVPSIMSDDHVHFVDGAAGGYAKAASMIKSMLADRAAQLR